VWQLFLALNRPGLQLAAQLAAQQPGPGAARPMVVSASHFLPHPALPFHRAV
jgi:hypothetical protein